MQVHISDHFTIKHIIRAVYPTIFMMLFTSIYGIVDGLFVSNVAGKTAFAAVNFVMPITMIVGAIGFMLGAGGSAIVSKTLGEGDKDKANSIFTSIVIFTIILGLIVCAVLFVFVDDICILLGASDELLTLATLYGRILIGGEIFFMLQNLFQSFFVVAEKPMLGFVTSIIAGVTNMILDALLIAVFNLGVVGAATATVFSQIVGATIAIIYFLTSKTTNIHFAKPLFKTSILLNACTNGSSELLSNISSSVVGMVYNVQLLKYSGTNGVAAYGIIMYVGFIFAAIFIGYSMGVAPIVGYNYGAQNKKELQNVLSKSLVINTILGVLMATLSIVFARVLSSIFVGYDQTLLDYTTHAMRIYSICFVLVGINIFLSAFFTALSNGLISAIISTFRTIICQIGSILLLPLLLGENGIWGAVIVSDTMACILGIIFLLTNNKRYGYLKTK